MRAVAVGQNEDTSVGGDFPNNEKGLIEENVMLN